MILPEEGSHICTSKIGFVSHIPASVSRYWIARGLAIIEVIVEPLQEDHMEQTAAMQRSAEHRDDVVQELPPSENKRFYPALDGLRALAILMVFSEHYGLVRYPALNWGWVGVDVFFVLSGFLITGILYDTRNTAHRFRNFYARRTLRIFPLYYGVLLFGLVLTPLFHWRWNRAWFLWFVYLGNYARFIWIHSPLFPAGALEHLVSQVHTRFLPALYLGHFWSLCVEEQFYLVWPFVVFLIRDRVRLRNLCIVVCCLALLARILCVLTVPPVYLQAEFLYRLTPLRVDALLLGGLVALCLRGPEGARMLRLARPLLTFEIAGLALFELWQRFLSSSHIFYHPSTGNPYLSTIGFTLIDLVAATLIVVLLRPGGVVFGLFNLKWARQLGQISYGFYVFHDMFHHLYVHVATHLLGHTRWVNCGTALTGLICTTLLAYVSFRFYEAPILRYKDRFAPHPAIPQPVSPAQA